MRHILIAFALFVVSGCGPSANDQKAKTDLLESQKQIEAAKQLHAEVLRTKQAEIDNLKKEVASLKEKTAVPPEYQILGEVFIVTKGGQNLRMGLIQVMVFESKIIRSYIEERLVLQQKSREELKPQWEEAIRVYDSAKDAVSKTKPYRTDDGREIDDSDRHGKVMALIEKKSNYESMYRKYHSFLEGSFFFDELPKPLRIGKTNSEGRFRISVPRGIEAVIGATASRSVGERTETYYWLLSLIHI